MRLTPYTTLEDKKMKESEKNTKTENAPSEKRPYVAPTATEIDVASATKGGTSNQNESVTPPQGRISV